jgi:protein CpxP
MNKHNGNTSTSGSTTVRRWLLAIAILASAGAMATASAAYAGGGDMFAHHGHGSHQPMDAAAMDKHIDKLVERVLGDGTPAQKAQLATIARSAMNDAHQLHAQMRQAHQRMHALLMAPVVDRAALEQLRLEQVQQVDAVSKRIVAALADAAELLTPAQRAKLADHLGRRMH